MYGNVPGFHCDGNIRNWNKGTSAINSSYRGICITAPPPPRQYGLGAQNVHILPAPTPNRTHPRILLSEIWSPYSIISSSSSSSSSSSRPLLPLVTALAVPGGASCCGLFPSNRCWPYKVNQYNFIIKHSCSSLFFCFVFISWKAFEMYVSKM